MSTTNSGRNSPDIRTSTESLNVPKIVTSGTTGEKPVDPARTTRSNSPSRLPTELTIKYQTQLNRVSYIEDIGNVAPDSVDRANITEINEDLDSLEIFHQEFLSVHSSFEMQWPATFLDHPYFANNLHQKEAKLYRKAKLALGKIKHALTGALQVPATQPTHESRFESKLPDIALPSFSGGYSEWPAFREMFTCLILDNERLSNVERLHYLRSCMEGAPAQLIGNFPLVGTSLQPSWELLTKRYENKRLLIQAQLDKMCHLNPLTSKSARGLTALINTVTEAKKALESLNVTDLGDHMITYHVSRHLDRSTREAWETSLGSSNDYPTLAQLEKFINSRARALERIESSPATNQPAKHTQLRPQSTPRKSATVHQAATTSTNQREDKSANTSSYYCDCCDGNHFIVTCPKFRDLDTSARRNIIELKRLCYNCMGRCHSAHACRTTQGCKHCSGKHHTMLHNDKRRSTQQEQHSPSEPQPSTSSASH